MDETIKWTPLRDCDIARYLEKSYQVEIESKCVKQILHAAGYQKKKPAKQLATDKSTDRSEQFRVISFLSAVFLLKENNPIFSINIKNSRFHFWVI
jgi:Rhodopirellula transposase DDE domain/Winged helix-turn helix